MTATRARRRTFGQRLRPPGRLSDAPADDGRSGRASLVDFIASHPVFRVDELAAAYPKHPRQGLVAALAYHVNKGRIINLYRGVYFREPVEDLDPWLIASRLTPDGVIAYEGALSFHKILGLDYSISILSKHRLSYFCKADVIYKTVRNAANRSPSRHPPDVEKHQRQGLDLFVCSRERALADCCDRPDLPYGGLENLTRAFLRTDGLDPMALARAAESCRSAITAARVGLLIEAHRHLPYAYQARDALGLLARLRPKTPTVFDPAQREGGHLVSRWNAIIPDWFLQIRQNLL